MLHDCIWSSDSRRQLNAFVSQQLDKIAKPSVFATNAFMTRIQWGDRRKKLKQKGKKKRNPNIINESPDCRCRQKLEGMLGKLHPVVLLTLIEIVHNSIIAGSKTGSLSLA